MEKRKKLLILATVILAIAAIVLVVTSLATENWVQSTPARKNYTTENNEVSFGLFKGNKVLNFGFASRPSKLDSKLSLITYTVACLLLVLCCYDRGYD